jgi:hypothetical protein
MYVLKFGIFGLKTNHLATQPTTSNHFLPFLKKSPYTGGDDTTVPRRQGITHLCKSFQSQHFNRILFGTILYLSP